MHKLLFELPNEVIINVFKCLDLIDLLNISLIKLNDRLKYLLNEVLLIKLSTVRLRLLFNQENNWKYTLDFQLKKATDKRLAFTPIIVPTEPIRLYTSKFLRKPLLMKASLLLHGENKHLKSNLLKSSLSFSVKDTGLQQIYSQEQRLLFVYKVEKTPKHFIKIRPGERFIEPLGFECPYEFLSQQKSKLQTLASYLHNKPKAHVNHPSGFTATSKLHNPNNQLSEIDQFYEHQRLNPLSKSKSHFHSLKLIG